MQFQRDGHIGDSAGVIGDVCQTWLDLYSDLYRETHEETATQGEILADAELRLQILNQAEIAEPDYFVGPIEFLGK